MRRSLAKRLIALLLLLSLTAGNSAWAQKRGGVLKLYSPDSPGNMSMHEGATLVVEMPMMGVFNNLIMFDQHKPQVSLESIVPDLATEWSWNEDGTALTFKLREGVKWHDGKPFTAADVKCTVDLLLDKTSDKLRLNPRKSAFDNLADVISNGDYEVTFQLKRPQPAFPMLLAGGFSVIYPCHVSATQMRQHPIGTGPFKFVEFKPNESVKVTRNPDYWKPGRPYLDAIEYTLMSTPSTAILAFAAGKFDRAWQGIMSIPLMKQLKDQEPNAECTVVPWNIPRQMLVNRSKPPFDNPELRRAMGLTLDRRAFIDILSDGQGEIGGAMMPPPAGSWGMPPEMLQTLPGYRSDIVRNRAEAREITKKLGYGPDKRLSAIVTTRNVGPYRDAAVLLIDQLKEIFIDATLNAIDTTQWYPTVMRKDYALAFTVTETGLDDPDQMFSEHYSCGSDRNHTGYSHAEANTLIAQQSAETAVEKR